MNNRASLFARAGLVAVSALALTVTGTAVAAAQTPTGSQIVEKMIARQEAELANVKNYWVKQVQKNSLMSQAQDTSPSTLYYERRVVDGRATFVSIPPGEYVRKLMQEKNIDPSQAPGTTMGGGEGQQSSPGGGSTGSPAGSGMAGMPGASGMGGLPGGLKGGLMQGGMNKMLDALDKSGESLASPDPALMRAMGERAKVTGPENVDGHRAWVLHIDDFHDLDLTGGQGDMKDFTPTSATLYIDADRFVSLEDAFDGVVHSQGDQPVHFVVHYEDYQDMGGMLKPWHTVIEMGGGLMEQAVAAHQKDLEGNQERLQKAIAAQPKERQKQLAMLQKKEDDLKKSEALLHKHADKMSAEQLRYAESMLQQNQAMIDRQRAALLGHKTEKGLQRAQAANASVMGMSGGFSLETTVQDMGVNEGPPEPEWMKQAEAERAGQGGDS